MKCPTCGARVVVNSNHPDWVYDLIYLAKSKIPIWGGPLRRGIDLAKEDINLGILIQKGYARQIEEEGFVITEFGLNFLSQQVSQ